MPPTYMPSEVLETRSSYCDQTKLIEKKQDENG